MLLIKENIAYCYEIFICTISKYSNLENKAMYNLLLSNYDISSVFTHTLMIVIS